MIGAMTASYSPSSVLLNTVSAGIGALHLDARSPKGVHRRPEYTILFVAKQSTVRGMRIQRAERDSRTGEIPVGFKR